jgi:hypothetical protein
MTREEVDERHARIPVGAGHRRPDLHSGINIQDSCIFMQSLDASGMSDADMRAHVLYERVASAVVGVSVRLGASQRSLGYRTTIEGVPAPSNNVVQLQAEDAVALERQPDDLDPCLELRLDDCVGPGSAQPSHLLDA